jgi:hypothetical protein
LSNIVLSTVIVNYRSWNVLQKCLDSFSLHSPKLNYEIILVDNSPQDSKLESFSKKYFSVNFIENSGNYSLSNGCNLVAKNAKGEYLLFLNPIYWPSLLLFSIMFVWLLVKLGKVKG